ncbi:R3H domain-containing protein 4-like [Diadema antillarum]|uniref:R3H domain-containing protein 4-like n=1 Tax=Diadema antillarum TaxID=105358 RepID=UPI003A8646FD
MSTNFLFTLLDEEYSVKDPEITDFISSNQSAFEQLFLQQEQMEIWSEFMNRSEEEQDRFLREVEEGMFQVAKKASGRRAAVQDKNGNPFSEVEPPAEKEKPTEVVDQRKDNPAHTPQECFKRISTRLQTMLRRRHLPKGAVEGHEEELLEWFGDDPSSVFISSLPSSFDRLLLHAVCQYLDLSSESFDCEGRRQTRVENNNEFFRPPSMLLSAYLDSLR